MNPFNIILATFEHHYYTEVLESDWKSFQQQFNSEEAAIAFLFCAKWPNGFRCPRCNHQDAYVITTRKLPLYECHSCRHQTSLTAGTVMESSRTSMLKWLAAFFLISRKNIRINAIQLQRYIHVTYKTAWTMLHVIRRAINAFDTAQTLSGTVKGVVGFCSQLPYNPTSNLRPQEKPVLIAATIDEHNKKPVILKMKLVDRKLMNTKHLPFTATSEFTNNHISRGITDVQFYQRFTKHGFRSIKNIFDNVMFQQTRTFKGLTSRYLQYYIDEVIYRLNLNLQNKPILENLTQLCMATR